MALIKSHSFSKKCELCETPFQFTPKYIDGTPERLRLHEAAPGVMYYGFDQWLPYLLRLVFCAVLWLFALPLATAHFYYVWLHHPSTFTSRWKYDPAATLGTTKTDPEAPR
jgi:E3 ubiquitin-protein ligase DOA10